MPVAGIYREMTMTVKTIATDCLLVKESYVTCTTLSRMAFGYRVLWRSHQIKHKLGAFGRIGETSIQKEAANE